MKSALHKKTLFQISCCFTKTTERKKGEQDWALVGCVNENNNHKCRTKKHNAQNVFKHQPCF